MVSMIQQTASFIDRFAFIQKGICMLSFLFDFKFYCRAAKSTKCKPLLMYHIRMPAAMETIFI
ncbi:MAG: hypothetical protein DRH32_09825 [Deltaproteobacteria bacterium]|nr:MAG: hypothetical protein DRH32_09825 [Deltaproteobacteria bacterium]